MTKETTTPHQASDEADIVKAKRNEAITQVLDPDFLKQREHRVANIAEELCIGCVKCIEACPFDAIVGAAKQMHTVIPNDCTGCQLCIEPCPVDCIEMIEPSQNHRSWQWSNNDLLHNDVSAYKSQYERHFERLDKIETAKAEKRRQKKRSIETDKKQDYIRAAVERARARKMSRPE